MDIERLSFSHRSDAPLLDKLTFQIPKGRITTIIGPNGSGKSTLLGVLSRNHLPYEGSARIDGKEIADFKPKELARKLAVVHQQNSAPEDMTVERLVAFGRQPHRSLLKPHAREDEACVDWALAVTGLLDKRSEPLARLSGGEKQRAWIGMALAQRTGILFLDEPTTFLDPFHQLELMELVQALNREQNLTIVMVLHDMNQALRYSDELIVMKAGAVAVRGRPELVLTPELIADVYGVKARLYFCSETKINHIQLIETMKSKG